MNSNIAEQMVTIGINVRNPTEAQLSAINDLVRTLGFAETQRSESAATSPSAAASGEFVSEEYLFQRKTLDLLEEFEKRKWEIPKGEIAVINGRIFENRRQAAALYAKRSGFFTFDSKSQKYVGTRKAKEELLRLRKLITKEIVNALPTPNSAGDLNFDSPRFLENPMVQLASNSDSFFSDLTAEGLAKLEKSLSPEERGAAADWLQSAARWFVDNLTEATPLTDFFEFADNVRRYLDGAASSLKRNTY